MATTTVRIEGDWCESNAAALEFRLRQIEAQADDAVRLDLSACDIEDAVAVVTCVNAVRELRARVSRLTLVGAPQMLCHNLYRVGLLDGNDAIQLVDMRLDEPSGQ